MVLFNGAVGFQTILEAMGNRGAFLCAVFVGVVPVLTGLIAGAAADLLAPAVWLGGLSPLSGPAYSVGALLSTLDFSAGLMRSVPRAFWFWQGVTTLTALWLCVHLWQVRRARAALAASGGSEASPASSGVNR